MDLSSIFVVDVETSGLCPRRHGLLEIGAVNLGSGAEFETKVWLPPSLASDEFALRVNGTSEVEARTLSALRVPEFTALASFFDFVGASRWILAGMNPQFDRDFLRAGAERAEMETVWNLPSHRMLDLHSLAVGYWAHGGWERYCDVARLSTDDIYLMLGLPEEVKPHRAIEGARREAGAFRILLGVGK